MVLICPLRSQTTDTLTTDRWAVVYTARQVLMMICPFIERHVNMQAINTISLTFCLDFLSNNIQNKNNVCVCVWPCKGIPFLPELQRSDTLPQTDKWVGEQLSTYTQTHPRPSPTSPGIRCIGAPTTTTTSSAKAPRVSTVQRMLPLKDTTDPLHIHMG